MAVEFLPGNRLTLLRSGVEYFPALEAAIRESQREIFLETYIYAGDATGERITKALCGAARRGAAVHVLVDGFGSRDMPAQFARDLRDAGARLLVFRPEVWRFPLRRDRLRRMHRKIAVADGRIAFVGGINIIDDMDTPRQKPPRYDYAVKVEGPLLGPIRDSAVRLWNRIALARLERGARVSHPVPPHVAHAGSQHAAPAVRDNLRHPRDIEAAYLAAVGSAQEGQRGGGGPAVSQRSCAPGSAPTSSTAPAWWRRPAGSGSPCGSASRTGSATGWRASRSACSASAGGFDGAGFDDPFAARVE